MTSFKGAARSISMIAWPAKNHRSDIQVIRPVPRKQLKINNQKYVKVCLQWKVHAKSLHILVLIAADDLIYNIYYYYKLLLLLFIFYYLFILATVYITDYFHLNSGHICG